MDLLREFIVFQVFSPQVTKINIYIYLTFIISYIFLDNIWVVLGDYYNLNLGISFGLP